MRFNRNFTMAFLKHSKQLSLAFETCLKLPSYTTNSLRFQPICSQDVRVQSYTHFQLYGNCISVSIDDTYFCLACSNAFFIQLEKGLAPDFDVLETIELVIRNQDEKILLGSRTCNCSVRGIMQIVWFSTDGLGTYQN